jgi:hypothetical protein
VTLYSNGLVGAQFVFNAIGASATNWFSLSNLISAMPYNLHDLKMSPATFYIE